MIENLVFDLGNVLIEWNPEKILAYFVPDQGDRRLVKEAVFDSGLWSKTDSGSLTLEEASQEASALLPAELASAAKNIFYHWYEVVDVYHDLQHAIEKWAKLGYKIYILSTTCEIFYHIDKAGLLPISSLLSGKVLSSEVQVVKPQPEIYQILLETCNLQPGSSVFIDDIQANLDTAQELGFSTILAKGEADNIAAMQALLKAKGRYGAAGQ